MLKIMMIDVLDGLGEIPITIQATDCIRLSVFIRDAKALFIEREEASLRRYPAGAYITLQQENQILIEELKDARAESGESLLRTAVQADARNATAEELRHGADVLSSLRGL